MGYDLHTPAGILEFNMPTSLGTDGSGLFLLNRTGCSIGAPLRVTSDDAPQQHGGIPHPEWWSGIRTTLAIELWKDRDDLACGGVLRSMNDLLMKHLVYLTRGGGRLVWTPTGAADRMVDDLWLLSEPVATHLAPTDVAVGYTVQFVSPFPYAMTAADTATGIASGASATLDNVGTIGFYPVMRVPGPTSGFTIRNETSGLELVYNAALPGASAIGGGHYVELDFFRNTAYLDGSGASRKAGIDVLNSDFFTLDPGPNLISITGASMVGTVLGLPMGVIWQPAWA